MKFAMRLGKRLLLVAIGCTLAAGTMYSTQVVIQKKISVTRTLAGHAYIRGTDLPARGLTVELCSSGWRTVLSSTKTDDKGHFAFRQPPSARLFYLRLSAPGLDIYQLRVRIKKHAARELKIYINVAT